MCDSCCGKHTAACPDPTGNVCAPANMKLCRTVKVIPVQLEASAAGQPARQHVCAPAHASSSPPQQHMHLQLPLQRPQLPLQLLFCQKVLAVPPTGLATAGSCLPACCAPAPKQVTINAQCIPAVLWSVPGTQCANVALPCASHYSIISPDSNITSYYDPNGLQIQNANTCRSMGSHHRHL
jgi:hypothetical protein